MTIVTTIIATFNNGIIVTRTKLEKKHLMKHWGW